MNVVCDVMYYNCGDWRFVDISGFFLFGYEGYMVGIVVGDWNNDGFFDFFLNCYGVNFLYENFGDGIFVSVFFVFDENEWGVSVSFFDVN